MLWSYLQKSHDLVINLLYIIIVKMPVALPRPAVQALQGQGAALGQNSKRSCPSPSFDARSLRSGETKYFDCWSTRPTHNYGR